MSARPSATSAAHAMQVVTLSTDEEGVGVLAVAKIKAGRAPMVLPSRDGALLKDRFRAVLTLG